ncbi:MAG TPA: FliM/FliN family flagellar motor switch protein [Solirubrobacteraceae bacterium]|nr:FliM/FliN family flagellar motor switch protein [Solirubrobacteraceae bacterium]
MTGDRLNPDQVAALVEAAKRGELPEQATAIPRRGHRLRTVDFSRPTKFTADHQRRIARAIDTFCQTSVTRLSTELRTAVELETINTTQATWSGAQSQLPGSSLWVTLEVQPLGTRLLLTVEQSFILMCLDCLLGGSPDKPPRERRFSEIDTMLTQRLIESMIHQLSLVWHDLAGVTLSLVEIETFNDASQIAAVSEPTLVVVIESRINKHSASMALLIPWIAIDSVADHLSGKETDTPESDLLGAVEIGRAVAAVPVTLRAEVAAVDMPIDEILSMGPGSVIKLGVQAEQGVTLFAENVKLARAQPGCNGARRAVQVSGTERRFG